MISAKIRIAVAILVVLGFWIVNHMVKKRSLELKYSLIWTIIGVIGLVIDLFPGMLPWISRALGIELVSNMLLVFGLFFAIIIIFYLTVNISRLSNRERKLTQEVALLRRDIEEMNKKADSEKG